VGNRCTAGNKTNKAVLSRPNDGTAYGARCSWQHEPLIRRMQTSAYREYFEAALSTLVLAVPQYPVRLVSAPKAIRRGIAVHRRMGLLPGLGVVQMSARVHDRLSSVTKMQTSVPLEQWIASWLWDQAVTARIGLAACRPQRSGIHTPLQAISRPVQRRRAIAAKRRNGRMRHGESRYETPIGTRRAFCAHDRQVACSRLGADEDLSAGVDADCEKTNWSIFGVNKLRSERTKVRGYST